MGIYDRTYYRDEQRGGLLDGRSMVVNLILTNVVFFVAQQLVPAFSTYLELPVNFCRSPWLAYQLVTYGFLHFGVGHIFFNMLALFFFGREIEGVYGPREFLRFYLSAIAISGLVWALSRFAAGTDGPLPDGRFPVLVGASGAVMGVMALFVCHFPKQLIYIWGVLPVPAWALGLSYFLFDVMATVQQAPSDMTAHVAHVAGAVFGFIYFRSGWNLGRLMPGRVLEMVNRPKLRVHDPDAEEPTLSQQVDQILEKIHRDGESSLSKHERQILEEASRRYQRRRQ